MSENTQTQVKNTVVLPAMSGDEALKVWKQYQDLINKICTDDDYQIIEEKRFRKKSGWRKIATFFNLSLEVVEEKREQIGKTFAWHFTCKAIAPNGRFSVGTGSCDAYEKAVLKDGEYMRWNKYKKVWEKAQPNSIHNIRSTAETRAFNRAVSNLVGGGEVSAEEITLIHDEESITEDTSGNDISREENVPSSQQVGKCKYCSSSGKYHKRGCPAAKS